MAVTLQMVLILLYHSRLLLVKSRKCCFLFKTDGFGFCPATTSKPLQQTPQSAKNLEAHTANSAPLNKTTSYILLLVIGQNTAKDNAEDHVTTVLNKLENLTSR